MIAARTKAGQKISLNCIIFGFRIFNYILYIIILADVLFGCETWSLTLREERGLMVFENMVLRRIFGPERDEVTGERRKLHSERSLITCTPRPILVE